MSEREKRTKEYKEKVKNKKNNRNSRTSSSITKTKIAGSREIRSNMKRGKRKIGRGENEQDRCYTRKRPRARISNGGKNPDGSGIEDIR